MENSGFQEGKIPQQQKLDDGTLFPIVLLPQHQHANEIQSFLNAIQQHTDSLTNLLQKSGALLFRGFPVKNASDFNAVVEAFGWEEQPYLGNASRTRIVDRVYTANEAPLHQPIHLHNEMSVFKEFPAKLLLFCEVAPPEGGQTAIVSSHKIIPRMQQECPNLVEKLQNEGLMYMLTMPAEDNPNSFLRGWQTHLQTKDKEEAEKKASRFGMKTRWLQDGSLTVTFGPHLAIREIRGKKAWFNSIAVNKNSNSSIVFEDGSPLPVEAIETCFNITLEESVEINWEVGDVLLIDNIFVQHARRPSQTSEEGTGSSMQVEYIGFYGATVFLILCWLDVLYGKVIDSC